MHVSNVWNMNDDELSSLITLTIASVCIAWKLLSDRHARSKEFTLKPLNITSLHACFALLLLALLAILGTFQLHGQVVMFASINQAVEALRQVEYRAWQKVLEGVSAVADVAHFVWHVSYDVWHSVSAAVAVAGGGTAAGVAAAALPSNVSSSGVSIAPGVVSYNSMLRYKLTTAEWGCGSSNWQQHVLGGSTSYFFPKTSMDGINSCCYQHDEDYCCQIGRGVADEDLMQCLHRHCVDEHCTAAIDVYRVLLGALGDFAYDYAATDYEDCHRYACNGGTIRGAGTLAYAVQPEGGGGGTAGL